MVLYAYMSVFVHSRFIENPPMILGDKPLIFEVVLSQNVEMDQRLMENEKYNLQVQEYYRQREEQRDTTFAQQQVVLQVSMIVNKQLLEN
jgi:hypothetical protein